MARKLYCLSKIYKEMCLHNTSRASAVILMHNKRVNCVFTTFNKPFYLHVAAVGRNDLSIEFSILPGFTLQSQFVANLSEWARFFGLKYNPDNHYTGSAFIDELERELYNSKLKFSHGYSERIKGISSSSDKEGFIFCGTYNNPVGKHVTKENYTKTLRAFGKSVADHLLQANISTRWTTVEAEENLSKIIDMFPNLQF